MESLARSTPGGVGGFDFRMSGFKDFKISRLKKIGLEGSADSKVGN